jgi:hypothetical protein
MFSWSAGSTNIIGNAPTGGGALERRSTCTYDLKAQGSITAELQQEELSSERNHKITDCYFLIELKGKAFSVLN